MNTFIYGLFCPVDGEIKYIGKSNNPHRRLRDHMCDSRGEYSKGLWLRKLKHSGLKPQMEILDEIPLEKWQFWERWWIAYFKTLGIKLLNQHEGGNGLAVANHRSFKAGNKPWNSKK